MQNVPGLIDTCTRKLERKETEDNILASLCGEWDWTELRTSLQWLLGDSYCSRFEDG
jgi:hypothetical protein